MRTITIGKSDLTVPALGVGTWQWGDRGLWGYGTNYGRDEVTGAYRASRDAGLTFFDTAEIYGNGASETNLGLLAAQDPGPVVIATKFAPLRLTAGTLHGALTASLKRLGRARVDLYQIHWPYGVIRIAPLMEALANEVAAGRVRAVGVSNYSASQMRRAHALLAGRGVALASNQVHYSLLHRNPERNGVLAACRELGVTLIAYSPLEQGLLTGKYHPDASAGGADGSTQAVTPPRILRRRVNPAALQRSAALVAALRAVGAAHGGKTPAQVALAWLIHQGTLPIPGAKSAAQASANAGALGWDLDGDEIERIRNAAP
jgi:aryl-alcohol dehydrogenase-like predicted oxidoreductase